MNTLSLQIRKGEGDHRHLDFAHLTIDDRSLIEMVREVELPYAQVEGSLKLAGAYAPFLADTILLPSTHLLGTPEPIFAYDGLRVSLLECECGCAGCWPLIARITLSESTVTWSDFEQVHRGPDAVAGHWNYEGFGPFTFSREQYLAAIARHACAFETATGKSNLIQPEQSGNS